jgi:hypothetical protein
VKEGVAVEISRKSDRFGTTAWLERLFNEVIGEMEEPKL